MIDNEFLKDLDALVEKLDSSDSRKAWGEIVVSLIKSNAQISINILGLVRSLDQSSAEATRINRRIMYLTIAVALSAVIAFVKDMIAIFG